MATTKAAPIWKHPTGLWCKKYRGTFYYFGYDFDVALKRYVEEWAGIKAGNRPGSRAAPLELLTVRYLCNHFLASKLDRMNTGQLSKVSYR